MNLTTLDTLTDTELRAVIEQSNELLTKRDQERKAKALEQATALLASVGLDLKDLPKRPKARAAPKESLYKKGHVYRHPDDPKLTFKGGGMVPKWVLELHSAGVRALEVKTE